MLGRRSFMGRVLGLLGFEAGIPTAVGKLGSEPTWEKIVKPPVGAEFRRLKLIPKKLEPIEIHLDGTFVILVKEDEDTFKHVFPVIINEKGHAEHRTEKCIDVYKLDEDGFWRLSLKLSNLVTEVIEPRWGEAWVPVNPKIWSPKC